MTYIHTALDGFEMDPPDSDFQRGYKAALEIILKEADLYSRVEVEAAQCVWEELLDRHKAYYDHVTTSAMFGEQPKPAPNLYEYWESFGSSQVRQDAIDIGVWVEQVWLALSENERDTIVFDWEFVPRLLDQLHPYWSTTNHMYQRSSKFPTPTVESAVAHYRLAYGYL